MCFAHTRSLHSTVSEAASTLKQSSQLLAVGLLSGAVTSMGTSRGTGGSGAAEEEAGRGGGAPGGGEEGQGTPTARAWSTCEAFDGGVLFR